MKLSLFKNLDGGSVSVEDGVKATEEFAPARKVKFDLNFSFFEDDSPEDIQELLDRVGPLASERVRAILQRTNPPAAPKPAPKTAEPAADAADLGAVGETADPKPAAKTKAKGKAAPPSGDPASVTDLGAVGDPEPDKDPAPKTEGQSDLASVGGDDWDKVEPITDAQLNAATQKRNGELGKPTAIRDLIASFFPKDDKVRQLREIPAEQRQDYLDKLAALS